MAMKRCRVVRLEWDRTHETIEGILRAKTRDGIVVSEIFDLRPLAGLRWIRRDEVVSLRDVDAKTAMVRSVRRHGALEEQVDEDLTKLRPLLRHLRDEGVLVGLYVGRTGSSESQVGFVRSVDRDRIELDYVTPSARRSTTDRHPLEQIISVVWGNEYLADLTALLEDE